MFSAVVGHLVGDFLLQPDILARNKKSSSLHCAVHCAIWALCVLLFAWWPWWTLLPLFVTHFIQDRTGIIPWYMDAVRMTTFKTGVCAPWSLIVVDNTWHLVAIWVISRFV